MKISVAVVTLKRPVNVLTYQSSVHQVNLFIARNRKIHNEFLMKNININLYLFLIEYLNMKIIELADFKEVTYLSFIFKKN